LTAISAFYISVVTLLSKSLPTYSLPSKDNELLPNESLFGAKLKTTIRSGKTPLLPEVTSYPGKNIRTVLEKAALLRTNTSEQALDLSLLKRSVHLLSHFPQPL